MSPDDTTSPGRRPGAALAFRAELQPWLFPPAARSRLEQQVEILAGPFTGADWPTERERLAGVEVLVGSWGIPLLDGELLAAMPRLRVVLYGAGSVRGFVTDEFWRRGILLSSAASANAGPTATFAEAMIILALKQTWFYLRRREADWAYLTDTASSGVHAATVGIIGLSSVGRLVVQGLQRHELTILACDPTVTSEEAARLGVELVDLPALFARSDVVSLHAPLLPQTIGLVGAEHLRLMKPHASFVNTARGAIVREAELVAVMRERADLTALLDVTDPEPAPADSPLRALPNVILTPHIAGARHREIALVGRVVLEELDRYRTGQPLRFALDKARVASMA
ncbi:D-3-phosphoglycerate dehydrogenase [Lacunisphaera limnophila]|uniref:D-3-phosphoglycerate dehydrogenase n=1 Tax=Lacunisphaera limnophila TaxID=1838286 RepID=A0A1D8ATW7_9BACT|nr:hydroxyacid dehydrogenase [Lacunisphaera limnophila]AOS44333.1 D-3-phosphoglycerate dehydrogenase [Lacunisphaera limnophila]